MQKKVDKIFLGIVITLVVAGFFIFFSASLGLYARDGAQFSSVMMNQVLALLIGGIGFFSASVLPYKYLQKFAFLIFFFSIVATVLVFVPGLGFEHGGAKRWILLDPFTIQPSEFLKLGFLIYLAAWLQGYKKRILSVTYGFLPLLCMLGGIGVLLLKQPDTGTFLIIFGTAVALFVAGGGPWKYAAALLALASAGVGVLAYMRPYVLGRILTFLNPAVDPQGAGYQIQQSLIAVGSGELFGRGFGQSVQKFNFLPEPISDSIFAVFAEEFGFIGSVLLIALFTAFALRGFHIARHAPGGFPRLLALGIVILITGQAFINIGSMIAVLPLTGVPLPFVSHGGSSLIFTLIGVGIVLNVSRYIKK